MISVIQHIQLSNMPDSQSGRISDIRLYVHCSSTMRQERTGNLNYLLPATNEGMEHASHSTRNIISKAIAFLTERSLMDRSWQGHNHASYMYQGPLHYTCIASTSSQGRDFSGCKWGCKLNQLNRNTPAPQTCVLCARPFIREAISIIAIITTGFEVRLATVSRARHIPPTG